MKAHRNHKIRAIVIGATCLAALAACSGKGSLFNAKLFQERAAETPPPSEQNVPKSFFIKPSGEPKTFMCALAPEVTRGNWGERDWNLFVNDTPHCNIQFEITEHELIGRLVQPSYMDDPSRWVEYIKIPITKHFYYERAKDDHGRDTNQWIQNDQRSHWSARPDMTLDLSHVEFMGNGIGGSDGAGMQINSVQDIDWDFDKNFLGFSINTIFSTPFGDTPQEEVQFRVNFLAFEHNPNFKKIPYAQSNSRFLNILHVFGRKVEGVVPELYVGHWDFSQPVHFYLNGVPKELQGTIEGVFKKWNDELHKLGILKADQVGFVPEIKQLDHPFDLRYPSITWVSDRRVAPYSPLGISLDTADVTNGQIMWSGVVLYGGLLQTYINDYLPFDGLGGADSDAGSNSSGSASADELSPIAGLNALIPKTFHAMDRLTGVTQSDRSQMIHNFTLDQTSFLKQEALKLQARQDKTQDLAAVQARLQSLQDNNPQLNEIASDLINLSQSEVNTVNSTFQHTTIQKLLGLDTSAPAPTGAELAQQTTQSDLARALTETNPTKRAQDLSQVLPPSSQLLVESDLTAQNLVGSIKSAPELANRDYPEILKGLVTEIALHELGHTLGMGHEFKENIVPDPGTVPSKYVKALAANATAKNEFSNYSSVMGYRSGRNEMLDDQDAFAPGPQDDLVLRYLYLGQYPVYDPAKDDWDFVKLPVSGQIPTYTKVAGKNLKVSYFPQCNDIDASYGADPFCNRWDRGTTAVDITRSYFQLLSDNLVANLYSLVGGGAYADNVENRLWWMALDTFSRVRLFYDEMRRQLDTDPSLKPYWDQVRADRASLLEFSQACQKDDPTDPKQVASAPLRKIFANAKIVDLCRANAIALNEFQFYLNLPSADYTKVDYANRYIGGGFLAGDASLNEGHIFGSWYQMTNLPLKLSAMYTLTTADPYIMLGSYMIPDFFYDTQDAHYLYRTLYPREYTKLISNTVISNMNFSATDPSTNTKIGRAILAMGSMLPWEGYTSNDAMRVPHDYNILLNQQTQFQYSLVAVLITAMKPDSTSNAKADHYKKFTANIYDFFTGKNTAARDVYILPGGDVIVWANGMFLYPMTKLKFFGDTDAYVLAYKIGYDYDVGDELIEDSVKSALLEKHNEIVSKCMDSLANYFDSSNQDFEGFYIPPGISQDVGKEKTGQFYDSITDAFNIYDTTMQAKAEKEKKTYTPIAQICDQALRGIGEISSTAALINGSWLGITPDYLEK